MDSSACPTHSPERVKTEKLAPGGIQDTFKVPPTALAGLKGMGQTCISHGTTVVGVMVGIKVRVPVLVAVGLMVGVGLLIVEGVKVNVGETVKEGEAVGVEVCVGDSVGVEVGV